jgi:ADP-heptose:LPS heptosyltransferase
MSVAADRVLVVKLADIGDAVLSLPAIQALRASLPEAKIDVLTTSAGANVFKCSPAIDHVITLSKERFDRLSGFMSPGGLMELSRLAWRLRSSSYDAVLILHHLTTPFGARKFSALARATGAPVIAGLDNGRGKFLTHRATDYGFGQRTEWQYALSVVEALGLHAKPAAPELRISDQARASINQLLHENGIPGSEYIVLHTEVGDFSPARAWPDQHFATLAQRLGEEFSLPLLLVGVLPEREGLEKVAQVEGVVNLVGRTTFSELCELVRGAKFVIGCDSSVAHLAGAMGRPGVTLFGPSNIDAWKPYGAGSYELNRVDEPVPHGMVAIHKNLPCSPCIYSGFALGRPQGCRSRQCMQKLSPDEVMSVVRAALNPTDSSNREHGGARTLGQ